MDNQKQYQEFSKAQAQELGAFEDEALGEAEALTDEELQAQLDGQ